MQSEEILNTISILVFSPLGFLTRLLATYVFRADILLGKSFAVFMINVFGSFVLGIVDRCKVNDSNKSLLKGISVGYCGCATTFGSLISLSADIFVHGTRESFFICAIGIAILVVGTESSRASYETGYNCLAFFTSELCKRGNSLPVIESTQSHNSLLRLQTILLWCLICIEIACYIVLIPFYSHTSYYLFGFIFTLVGVMVRYYASKYMNPIHSLFRFGTFACNVVGSIISSVVSIVLARMNAYGKTSFVVRSLVEAQSVGLSAALTTMSTFAKETVSLKREHFGWFVLYSYCSVLTSFGFCCLVFSIGL